MRKLCRMVFIALCATGWIAITSFGQPTAPAQSPASGTTVQLDKKADDVLRRMTDYFGKLPAFSCHVESCSR